MTPNIYIIHYTPLVERKLALEKTLPSSILCKWVTEKSPPSFTPQEATETMNIFGVAKQDLAMIHASHVLNTVYQPSLGKILTAALKNSAMISLSIRKRVMELFDRSTLSDSQSVHEVRLMHLRAWEEVSQSQSTWNIVFEDDSIITPTGWEAIRTVLDNSPAGIDLISLSKHKLKRQCRQGKVIWGAKSAKILQERTYFTPNAYMVRNDFAEKMIKTIKDWGLPTWTLIDFTYLALILKLQATMGFLCPSPVLQGSELGTYQSGFQEMRKGGNYLFRR
jgi:hypothetical protein